jgi:hypothetical protein
VGIFSRRKGGKPEPGASESADADGGTTAAVVAESDDGPRRSPDAPIECTDDDRLQRRPFARAIADDVRHAPRKKGFVIGLTGGWGEGKTSVINLLVEELKDDAIVVRFNPWLFSGTEQLIEHFFEELASQLREKRSDRLNDVAKALGFYGRAVAPFTVIPGIGELVRSSKDVSEKLSGALMTDEPSAQSRAADLRERLSELDRPVLVLVDDLDRLQFEEVIDTMRLVRLVGDFPNLVYVLAYDQPRIEQALGGDNRERGRAYLEKMVQATHRLPFTDPKDISDLFLEELDQTLGDTSAYRFSQDQFANLYTLGMRPLFSTVRDIRRYTNLLPATLAMTGDEVELADVLALEAIRLFLPDSFDRLIDARDALTTVSHGERGRAGERKQDEALVKSIVDTAGKHRTAAEDLVRRLFPASEHYFGGTFYGLDLLDRWMRERRVAHSQILDVYLRRRIPANELAAARIAEILSSLEDEAHLDRLLGRLSPEQFESVLIRLQNHENDFPKDHPEIAISLLLRHGQDLSRETKGIYDVAPRVELDRVVYRMLRNLDESKVEQVVEAIDYPNLSSRWDVVRLVGRREGAGAKLVSEATARRLEFSLAESILESSAEALTREPDIALLIGLGTSRLGDLMRSRIRKWSADDRFLAHLLAGHLALSKSQTVGDVAVTRSVILNWPAIVDLLTQEYAAERVKQLDASLFVEELGDDAGTVRAQALIYADDPEKGEEAMRRFQTEDEDDQGALAPS